MRMCLFLFVHACKHASKAKRVPASMHTSIKNVHVCVVRTDHNQLERAFNIERAFNLNAGAPTGEEGYAGLNQKVVESLFIKSTK